PFSAKSQGGISTVFGTDIEGEDDDDLDLDDEQFFHQQFMLNVDLCVKRARKIPKPDKKPGSASVYGDRNRIGGEMGYIKPLKPVPRVSSAPTTLKTPGSTGSRPTSAGSQIRIRPKSAPLLRKDKSKEEENEIVHQFLQCQIAEENNKIDKSAIMLKDMLMKRKQESQATNEKESMKALQFASRFIKKYVKQVLEEDKLIMVAATAAEFESIPYQEALALNRTRAADTTTRHPETHGHSLAYRKGRRERASIAEPDFWKPLNKKPYERTKTDVEVLYKMARRIPAFAKLNDYYLGEIVKVVTLVEFEEDEYVFRQGEEGTAWFIIISGSVSISITKTGDLNDSFVIRHMVAGEGFGDIALINKGPRTASVKAVCPSQLLKVEREDYDRLLKAMY
ncbi:cGMP-dependent protein kinase 1, partial [Rhizoclosmatium hyalinum]